MDIFLVSTLVVIAIYLIGIFGRLGSILQELQIIHKTQRDLNYDHSVQQESMLKKMDSLSDKLEDVTLPLNEISSKVDDIEHVIHIFGKYKLPSKKEQKELDDIALDMEVWDGISNSSAYRKD